MQGAWGLVASLASLCLVIIAVRGGSPRGRGGCFPGELSYQGSTPQLREIFVGRCWEYQVTRNPDKTQGCQYNCTNLWELFSQAFVYKEACSPTQEDYYPFLQAADEEIPPDSMVLWSGTYELSGVYSAGGRRGRTISDTLVGYAVDNLVWCGQVSPPGINYTACPAYGSCNEEGIDVFWAAASEHFARKASGQVEIVLTSTRENGWDAYHNQSLLHRVEIPNLPVENVTRVTVMLAKDIGKHARETCQNGSLLYLQETVEDRGLPYECVDQPEELKHILCVNHIEAEECQFHEANIPYNHASTLCTFCDSEKVAVHFLLSVTYTVWLSVQRLKSIIS